MEPTASLEVEVTDDHDKPLPDAVVATWPNVRYGEWSAVILGTDCYNTGDSFRQPAPNESRRKWWEETAGLYRGTSTVAGVVLLMNLPADVKELTVEHPRYVLPAVDTGSGQKRRQASVTLLPGQTNHAKVRLEPTGRSPITHY
jgi:hypothetical protein